MQETKVTNIAALAAVIFGILLPSTLRADLVSLTVSPSGLPDSWATVDTLNNLPLNLSQYNSLTESVDSTTTLTFSGAAAIKTGTQTSWGVLGTAPNYASTAQAQYFGQSASGVDLSNYLSVSSGGTATFTFSNSQSDFGLLWGTPDSYNTLSFYNGSSLLDSFTGSQIVMQYGLGYVDFTSSIPFTSVVLSSSGNSFEVDNIAHSSYSSSPAAPAPPIAMCLAFAGVLAFQSFRRHRQSV